MSVIVEVTLSSASFELGRILAVEGSTRVHLETMVPLGGRPTPFVRVHNDARPSFEKHVRGEPSVTSLDEIDTHGDETLYALAWNPSEGSFISGLFDDEVALLGATGGAETWEFELRFPTYDSVSEFREHCRRQDIDVTIRRLYNPTSSDTGKWYGLTERQRDTLMYAVEGGYYSLPRGMSTKQLGEEFDISDQAVTERLRRGIQTLVSNTLLVAREDEQQ